MTNPNPTNQNTLQSWATGKVAMSLIGFTIGVVIVQSGMLQKVISKIAKKKESE